MNAKYDDIVKYVLVEEKEIEQICKELGEKITNDYMGKDLVVVGMLKGAMPFMTEVHNQVLVYYLKKTSKQMLQENMCY